MIEITVPGYGLLRLEHLVLDYNGTLACDGQLLDGVRQCLEGLAGELEIHVLTADTFGTAKAGLQRIGCELVILPPEDQDSRKLEYVRRLGAERTACIGNGRNDRLMLKEAALGIAVLGEEGTTLEALLAADVVCTSIATALDLLMNPLRLVATLRS
jgi:P-type E1-E2 ATPase